MLKKNFTSNELKLRTSRIQMFSKVHHPFQHYSQYLNIDDYAKQVGNPKEHSEYLVVKAIGMKINHQKKQEKNKRERKKKERKGAFQLLKFMF